MHLVVVDEMESGKEMSRKEKFLILADLITDVCTYEEIIMFCAALLDASIKVRRRRQNRKR